jgi:peptide/histidine transporter 3/4
LEKSGGFVAFLFALYMVALGAGCLRPCLAMLGADQFDIEDPEEKKQIRRYFNWFFFAMSTGSMVAMMVVVYVAESVSWFWSFTIMGIAMFLSTACLVGGAGYYRHKKPQGSPLTRIAQVIVAASRKKKMPAPSDSAMLFEVHDHENGATTQPTEPTLKRYNSNKGEVLGEPTLKRYYSLPHTEGLGFLDKAAIVTEPETGAQSATVNPWRLCTITQVEELKTMVRGFPIIFTVSFLYVVVAQIQTWAVAQGYTMERTIGNFQFPPPSLSAISVAFVLFEIALYDRWFVPFVRRYTNHSHGITHLQRIGIGLAQSILAMAYGAIIETARLRSARNHGLTDNLEAVVPISIFWLLPMWILASSAELFAYVGLFEFFWQEMPVEMRSLGGGLSLFALALGYYQSGGLIITTNAITKSHNGGWLKDPNLNKNLLNYFYIILMVLSIFNAFGFVISTKWYNYVKFINTKLDSSNANSNSDHRLSITTSPIPDIIKRSENRVTSSPPTVSSDLIKNRDSKTLEEAPLPDNLPRSESRTPLRSTNNSDDIPDNSFASPTPPPRSPRNFFSHVFSPRHDADAAAPQSTESHLSPRFIKLDRSRSRAQSK